ncbi:MFS transporter [Streptacidiphilus monticola]|uniref:MFS transporter n=1 Tax=Streptacidiphilus monticola TaxID=2161674 RepID=A0ABW1FXV6_9ACTN
MPALPALPRISRGPAFWLVATVLLLLMFAASAPSPLYVVYQARWGFSAAVLTTVFAVYALFLLLALLVVGSLSDHLGRRPVLIASALLEAVAMLLFVGASGVGWLLVARAVQGVATGAATGALAAALIDLQPERRPGLGPLINGAFATLGLAAGALGSGLLVQYAPAPRTLVYVLLLAAFLLAALALTALPETAVRRPGAARSLLPRARVPRQARRAFTALVPGMIANWAVGGLYLSLVPSLVARVLHVGNHLVGGLAIATLCAAATVSSYAMRGRAARPQLVLGSAALAVGMLGTLAALELDSLALLFVTTAVAGVGFGVAFLGTLSTLGPLAAAGERAELFATLYVVNYLAFSLPAVVAGFAVPHAGLLRTAVVYGGVVAALSVASLVAALLMGRQQPGEARPLASSTGQEASDASAQESTAQRAGRKA